MSLANTTSAWGLIARLLHWIMAIMIVIMVFVGFTITNLPETVEGIQQRYEMTQMHKSFGFVVFWLAVLRVIWRLTSPATPALPDTMPAWQRVSSHVSHVLLYILILAIPLTGWLMSSASPLNDPGAYPVQIKNMVFGLFEMPDPIAKGSEELTQLFLGLHTAGVLLMLLVLLAHVGAALKHHFFDRDAVLTRMLTGRG